MSDQLELEFNNSEEIEEVELEDLDHYWMSNGLPVFMANRDNVCELVESLGFNLYYLLANIEETKTTNTTSYVAGKSTQTPVSVTTSKMQLFKVVNNFVGRSVSLSNESFDEAFIPIEEEAVYNMPAIPHVLIDKLDQFFRLVDAQHGTESIVMLTYDLDKEGPEGWGILVPDQTNTSVHCNYDPDSIAQIKPDNVMIVGSVHSHPGMAAYASGTDHKDQADFDGIHITFGWQKSVNNGATQYHIEMQMSGKAYTLDPEDVFEDFIINKAPDPEVVGWTDKVKKVLPPNTVGGLYTPTNGPLHQDTQLGTTAATRREKYQLHVPKFDVEPDSLIIAEVDANKYQNTYCPSCKSLIDEYDIFDGCCSFCFIPIAEKDTNVATILESISYHCSKYKLSTNVPVYLWGTDPQGADFVIRLTPNTLLDTIGKDLSLLSDVDSSEISLLNMDDFFDQKTVCCNVDMDAAMVSCYCDTQILPIDAKEFDDYTEKINLYFKNTICQTCEFYYDLSCPSYMGALKKFVNNPFISLDELEEKITGENCKSFIAYGSDSIMYDSET